MQRVSLIMVKERINQTPKYFRLSKYTTAIKTMVISTPYNQNLRLRLGWCRGVVEDEWDSGGVVVGLG